MSCSAGDLIACEAIQLRLTAPEFNGLTDEFSEPSPLVEFLTSPANTQGVIQSIVDDGAGKVKTAKVVYRNRTQESSYSNSTAMNCAGGVQDCELSTSYSIDTTVGTSITWSIELSDLQAACMADEYYVAKTLRNKLDGLIRTINTKTWIQSIALFGNFATSQTSTAINVATKNSTGVYVPEAIQKVKYEAMQNGYYGNLVAFGGNYEFQTYFDSFGYACCNTAVGMDLADFATKKGIIPIFDRKLAPATNGGFTTNEFVIMAPGTLQLLTYNQFRGSNGITVINSELLKQGVITDPRTGLTVDYYASYTCGVWNFQIKLAHKLIAPPADLFASGDRMNGVNWFNRFNISNP